MKQLSLFAGAAPAARAADPLTPWRAIGAMVRERGTGVSGTAIRVVGIASPIIQCGRYVWTILKLEERERTAWAHVRIHFFDELAAERIDVTQVEHIACGVERDRAWAEYLHECGYGQWLDRLSEPSHLGRELLPNEFVHHRNHNKRDNRIENLELMTPAEHAGHHNNKHPRSKPCAVCGTEFTPHPTKRLRAVTCSRECFSVRNAERAHIAKLTPEQVRKIRAAHARGESTKTLAESFEICVESVRRIIRRNAWRHVA